MTRLIVGCGYLGGRVARQWREAGHEVHVVTRSAQRAAALAAQGYQALVADVTRGESLPRWPAVQTVLYAVGYDRQAGRSLQEVYVQGLANVVASLPAPTGRFIYISSTGVYADAQGDWVDEQTACLPDRPAGRACLAAEQLLLASHLADHVVILRLAGLYGPGRIPSRDALAAGKSLSASPDSHLNLIHVDDAASAVLAAERADIALPRCYLVSDGHPARRREYYALLARLLGTGEPSFVARAEPDSGGARGDADKRISNARMRAELAFALRFESFREGLAAAVGEPGGNATPD